MSLQRSLIGASMQKTLNLHSQDEARALFGTNDSTLKRIRKALGIRLIARPDSITVEGENGPATEALDSLKALLRIVRDRGYVTDDEVDRTIRPASVPPEGESSARIVRNLRGRYIKPVTSGQAAYVEAMQRHSVVFAIGPAGTGKTYLAVAMALRDLKRGLFRRLILTRPAVEAGERLGFLPGDFQAKVHPYLRPLYDAIGDVIEITEMQRLLEQEILEVVPLAYMRGRTLDSAFIILDEAQNTTPGQMKMFLTRLGRNSKAVVTGDVTQVDLPDDGVSGLVNARDVLGSVTGVAFVDLGRDDIVRHPLVQDIVEAYGEEAARLNGQADEDEPEGAA
jgi:phosphate starvation-inducible protein PhoH and related proteins